MLSSLNAARPLIAASARILSAYQIHHRLSAEQAEHLGRVITETLANLEGGAPAPAAAVPNERPKAARRAARREKVVALTPEPEVLSEPDLEFEAERGSEQAAAGPADAEPTILEGGVPAAEKPKAARRKKLVAPILEPEARPEPDPEPVLAVAEPAVIEPDPVSAAPWEPDDADLIEAVTVEAVAIEAASAEDSPASEESASVAKKRKRPSRPRSKRGNRQAVPPPE